jgi:hypothetical protein
MRFPTIPSFGPRPVSVRRLLTAAVFGGAIIGPTVGADEVFELRPVLAQEVPKGTAATPRVPMPPAAPKSGSTPAQGQPGARTQGQGTTGVRTPAGQAPATNPGQVRAANPNPAAATTAPTTRALADASTIAAADLSRYGNLDAEASSDRGTLSPNMFGDIFNSRGTRIGFGQLDPVGGQFQPSTFSRAPAGITKISEENNPLPRDRFFYVADRFDTVQAAGGRDVTRHVFGAEKTFLDGAASIELRLPMAGGVATTGVFNPVLGGGFGGGTEFGDLHLTFKALLARQESFAVATGFGVSLPTADDIRIQNLQGAEIARIRNDSVILTPYAALLLTPNDRWFGQFWTQAGFDARGSRVDVQQRANPGFAGRLQDAGLLQFDAQVGYWLVQPNRECCKLRGLAAFTELHYNTRISNGDRVNLGQGLVIGDGDLRYDELNVGGGLTAILGDNLTTSLGVMLPVRGETDRTFDWQLGLRVNYYFGQTANLRSRSTIGLFGS